MKINAAGLMVLMMAGVALLSTGCVKIDSTIDLTADGSGTWRVVYAMPIHMIRQMETTRDMVNELARTDKGIKGDVLVRRDDFPYLFDEEAVRKRCKALESRGIVLSKVQTRSHGGWRYVDMTLKFTRLETLFDQSFFDSCGVVLSGAGTGNCKLVIALPDMGPPDELPNIDASGVGDQVSPFMNGLRVTARMAVPGDIRNSNSLMSDARHATWEWDFDRDARALNRLAREKIILLFNGTGIRLRDFSKPVIPEPGQGL